MRYRVNPNICEVDVVVIGGPRNTVTFFSVQWIRSHFINFFLNPYGLKNATKASSKLRLSSTLMIF